MEETTGILRVFADIKVVKLLGLISGEALPLHTLARLTGEPEWEIAREIALLKYRGLVQETFAADGFRWQYEPKPVFKALAALKEDAKPALDDDWTAEEARVLGDFFVHGRLTTIPAQHKKRLVVLRYLARQFEPGRTYTEQEVSFALLAYHEDYASLRREMVDTKLMTREKGIYRRLP